MPALPLVHLQGMHTDAFIILISFRILYSCTYRKTTAYGILKKKSVFLLQPSSHQRASTPTF
jgi:hypothetical protein